MIKKTLFILLFFISSCGYQPIYINKPSEIYEFKEVILNGDNYINNKIINILSIKENNEIDNKNIIEITSSFNTDEISKNSKGQVELYKSTINVNLEIKNINNQVIQKRNFAKEFRYNNRQNKFDLAQYQKSNKDDLINKIISDMIIFLNSE